MTMAKTWEPTSDTLLAAAAISCYHGHKPTLTGKCKGGGCIFCVFLPHVFVDVRKRGCKFYHSEAVQAYKKNYEALEKQKRELAKKSKAELKLKVSVGGKPNA
jgi:hypothetical protein